MKKYILVLLCFLFLSCSTVNEEEKTWQNEENINNSESEGYISQDDEWELLSDSWATISGSVSSSGRVISENGPLN